MTYEVLTYKHMNLINLNDELIKVIILFNLLTFGLWSFDLWAVDSKYNHSLISFFKKSTKMQDGRSQIPLMYV